MTDPVAKEPLHLLDHVIPIEFPCYSKKRIVGLITRFPERLQILMVQFIDAVGSAKYWTAKGCTSVEVGSHQFKDPAHWFIIAMSNLLQYNTTHLLQLFIRKGKCQQKLIDEVKGSI